MAAINKCKSSIENINDDYIPRKVYKEFLDLKTNMDLTHSQYSAYVKTIQLLNASGKLSVVQEDQAVKKWILDSRKEIKTGFIENLKVIQGYKNLIE